LRSGCQWRMLPREFPPWSTVHHYFRMWRKEKAPGRRSTPRCAKGYAQEQGAIPNRARGYWIPRVGEDHQRRWPLGGYDRAKTLSGRKRHLLVDTLGMVLRARVHTADIQDRAAVSVVLEGATQEFPRLEHLWVDQGYTGAGKAWIEGKRGWSVEVVKHPPKARGEWQPRGDLDDLSTVWFEWVRIPPEPKRFRGPLPQGAG
jgi:putative transposase